MTRELDEALKLERAREDLPDELRARMAVRLHAAVMAPPPVSAAPASFGWAKLIGAGLVGVLIGGALGVTYAPRAPEVAPRPRTVIAPAPIVVAPPPPAPPSPLPVEPAVIEAAPIAPPPAPRARVSIEEERALIDQARAALAHRSTEQATAALDEHAARFPHGELTEEREGLRVIALSRIDPAAARAQADRFARRYPSSVLRAAIDRALRSAPREDDHDPSEAQ